MLSKSIMKNTERLIDFKDSCSAALKLFWSMNTFLAGFNAFPHKDDI